MSVDHPDAGAGSPHAAGPVKSFSYDAFISYSHDDRAAATAIQRGLHRVGRRFGRVSALRVFRDATDLAASPDLWAHVSDALDSSRFFIAVLSSSAAASVWVNREIEAWLTRRGTAELLLVLAEGELTWDDALGRFDPGGSGAAPPSLTQPGLFEHEPLYVDVRGDAPWDLSSGFRDRLIDLAAPIHGTTKYQLASEDVRENRRSRRLRSAAVFGLVVLTVISVLAGSLAVRGRDEALRQRGEAIRQRDQAVALALAAASRDVIASNPALSVALAAEGTAATKAPLPGPVGALIDARLALAAGAPQRLREPLGGQGSTVISVAFSPDSRVLASSTGTSVQLWDPLSGQPAARPLTDLTGPVTFAGPERVLAAGRDGAVRLWDITTGAAAGRPLSDPGVSSSYALSPCGDRLVIGEADGMVRISGVDEGSSFAVSSAGHSAAVQSVAFSPRCDVAATSGKDGTIRLWDVSSGQAIGGPLTGHDDWVRTLTFSPTGDRLVSGGDDATVRLWDPATGEGVGQPLRGHSQWISSVASSPDGAVVASASFDGTVRLWDARTGEPLGAPLLGDGFQFWSVSFSPDGAMLAAGGADGGVRLWTLEPDRTAERASLHHADAVLTVAFGPRGDVLASGGADGIVRLWNPETGEEIGDPLVSGADAVVSLAFSEDGRRLAATGRGGAVRLWDAASGALATPDIVHPGAYSVAFDRDGGVLASASLNGTVRLWDAASAESLGGPLEGHDNSVLTIALSPRDGLLASGGGDGRVHLWAVPDGRHIRGMPFETPGGVWSVAFSPSADLLASGGGDGTIRLSAPLAGEVVGDLLVGHDGRVESVAFNASGTLLASSGSDGVRIWDPSSGRSLGPPFGDAADSIDFSPVDDLLAVAGRDGAVTLWDLWDTAEGCELAARYVTREQLRAYVPPDWQFSCAYTG